MALYVFRPKPDDVAKESLVFFQREADVCRTALEQAEQMRDATYNNYENSPDSSWQWGPVLERVESQAERLIRCYRTAKQRLDWEAKRKWGQTFPKPKPFSMPTPWTTDQKAWLKCFELDSVEDTP